MLQATKRTRGLARIRDRAALSAGQFLMGAALDIGARDSGGVLLRRQLQLPPPLPLRLCSWNAQRREPRVKTGWRSD